MRHVFHEPGLFKLLEDFLRLLWVRRVVDESISVKDTPCLNLLDESSNMGQLFLGQGQGYGNYQQQGRNQFVPSWNNQGNQVRNNPPGFQGNQGNRGGNQGTQWKNNQNNQNPNQGQFQQGNQNFGNNQGQGFSRPSQDIDMQILMNTMMAQMSKLQATVESQQATLSSQQVLIESLTGQQQGGGNQFSNQSSSSNGRLPASIENPRKQVNAVTTRSGLALKDPHFPSDDPVPEKTDKKDEGIQVEDVPDESEEEPVLQRDSAKGKAPMQDESAPSKKPEKKDKQNGDSVVPCNLLPFPQRLWRSKETERENKFKMMLDKLEISMPFVDAVTQIPSYKKFLKDILSNKKKLEKSAVVDLSEWALTCAVLQQKLPPNLKDLGSFTIPCIIGGFVVGSVLCDLGASVSLMPYSLCKRLNLGSPKPTTMTL
ncbi:putative mediator of RNA polymerase II transcription subunit 15 [Ipomoea triloba]|uniref:putative mediator of RNA polymerase II transcription subunit 15 n=1 Tax=Ipomoea triloba TaxID=35885 RepID=UPI00125DD05D|nr:putative mediator of RNA polymerase II transcription subunit 15 [Ipomoea triloba]